MLLETIGSRSIEYGVGKADIVYNMISCRVARDYGTT